MSYIQTITKGDLRWDELAILAYGDEKEIEPLAISNRGIPLSAVIPAGTKVNIPIVEQEEVIENTNSLPPWKR